MTFPGVAVDVGVGRQVMADHENLMVVRFCHHAGMKGTLHNYPRTQSTLVRSGRVDLAVAGKILSVGPGEDLKSRFARNTAVPASKMPG